MDEKVTGFKKVAGLLKGAFSGSEPQQKETGTFAGFREAYKAGILGDVPNLAAFPHPEDRVSTAPARRLL